MKKIKEIKSLLERVGLSVEEEDIDSEPFLIVKKNPSSKKSLCEIVFDKKGKITHFVVGKDEQNAAWISLVPKKKNKQKPRKSDYKTKSVTVTSSICNYI